MTKTIRASIYARISLDTTGDELGVDRQVAECKEFCARQGWEVAEVFVDNDISATTGALRPAFEALLQSNPQAIVCWHTDRLVRLSADLERVLELRVNVHGLTAGHLDLSTPAGRAVARTITAWAQYEGEQKAERQKAAARQRAKAGKPWWPRRPFGLNRDGTLHPEEAPALRQVYADLLSGSSLASLANRLAEQGFVTNRGLPWRATSLRPALLNARNAGIRVYQGEEIGPAAWEAIVPEETWRAAVRLLGAPQRRTGGGGGSKGHRINMLTGFAECGVCGSTVKTLWRGLADDPTSYKVYMCRNNHVTHRAEYVDEVVEHFILARLATHDAVALVGKLGAQSGDAPELQAEVHALTDRLNGLVDDYSDGLLSREELRRSKDRITARIKEARAKLGGIGLDAVIREALDADDLFGWWQDKDVSQRAHIAERVLARVVLRQRGKGRGGMKPEHVEVWFPGDIEPRFRPDV